MSELEYVEIESIELVGEEQTYDITMDDNPSFVANEIVVHNSGMRKLLQELASVGALTFDDLVAVVALFRPGPLDAGLCDEYIQIKQGSKVPYYESPNMEPALRETFGIMIYQEQIMRIVRDVAGFTLAEADHVRKAIGKKDSEKMKEMREKFVSGSVSVSAMDPGIANALWEKIEVFAGYSFNKSHSAEYSLISYWCMYLKTYYPAEFYAACMTVQDDADRVAQLVMDAQNHGLKVLPPDLNFSSDRVGIVDEKTLVAPFQSVKGISASSAGKFAEFRKSLPGGKFTKPDDWSAESQKKFTKARAILHSGNLEKLEKVGAMVSILGGVPAADSTRLRDRLELMPGFTVESVKATRGITGGTKIKLDLLAELGKMRTCEGCSLKGGVHAMPILGKNPKFMVVFDGPSRDEERSQKMMVGDGAAVVKAALKDVGLSIDDGYFTSLVKSPKSGKVYSNEQINGCSEYMKAELNILKPPVILVMGGNAMRFFLPSLKGNIADFAGKVIYDPKLEASIVIGVNPMQVFFDGSKIKLIEEACRKLKEIIV